MEPTVENNLEQERDLDPGRQRNTSLRINEAILKTGRKYCIHCQTWERIINCIILLDFHLTMLSANSRFFA